jgi:hypothetical protein
MAQFNREYKLLKYLFNQEVIYSQPPSGIGPVTIEICIKKGWVEPDIPLEYVPKNFKPYLCLTERGKATYLHRLEWCTGKTHEKLIPPRQEKLKKIIGEKAFKTLQNKNAVLKIWRRSQPFNQRIEDENGKTLWHSDDYDRSQRLFGIEIMFELVEHSKNIISVPSFFFPIPGNGDPEESTYRLKEIYC